MLDTNDESLTFCAHDDNYEQKCHESLIYNNKRTKFVQFVQTLSDDAKIFTNLIFQLKFFPISIRIVKKKFQA